MLSVLLSILLVLIIVGALLAWPYGLGLEYDPSDGASLVPLIYRHPLSEPGGSVGTRDDRSVRASQCASD